MVSAWIGKRLIEWMIPEMHALTLMMTYMLSVKGEATTRLVNRT